MLLTTSYQAIAYSISITVVYFIVVRIKANRDFKKYFENNFTK